MNYGTNDTKKVGAQYALSGNLEARIALHARFSTNPYGWSKWVFDQIDFEGKKRVLELGCGNGGFWPTNLDRIPQGLHITLSDFSAGMLESAGENLRDAPAAFNFQIIDAQSIPYEKAAFDIVIANHMLYHVPERKKALSEIHRVLKNDGVLYATTIGVSHLKELKEIIENYNDQIEYPAYSVAYDFGLENGAEQLAEFFDNIQVLRYADSFEVTDAYVLASYILSSQGFGNITEIITPENKEDFKNYLSAMIEKDGCIRITKDSGMLIAKK
jgi:ubiquinone/menaquinone biosynthesis C-methylase UbiE